MSRSGYIDDYDEDGTGGLWRGAVTRALAGRRGQATLKEIAAALDAMQDKSLAAESLVTEDGEFCTLGVLGLARGLDMAPIDPEDWDAVAKAFGVAPAMVREIVFENDESVSSADWVDVDLCGPVRPGYPDWGRHQRSVLVDIPNAGHRRWQHMRRWVANQIKATA